MNTSRIVQRTTSFVRGAMGDSRLRCLVAAPAPRPQPQQLSMPRRLDVDVLPFSDEFCIPQTVRSAQHAGWRYRLDHGRGDQRLVAQRSAASTDPPVGPVAGGPVVQGFTAQREHLQSRPRSLAGSASSPGRPRRARMKPATTATVSRARSPSRRPVVYPEADAMGRRAANQDHRTCHRRSRTRPSSRRSEGTLAALLVSTITVSQVWTTGEAATGDGSAGS